MSKNKLTLSEHSILLGVIGGFCSYFDVEDPTIARLGVSVAALLTGLFPLVLIYILAAIIMKLNK